MQKRHYIGRREFLEVFDVWGAVSERRVTCYDFKCWLVSDPYGAVRFRPKTSQPSWAELMADRRPMEREAAEMTGLISDYAPPGFAGGYTFSWEPHCGVPGNYYFRTLVHGVVVALDARARKFYVSSAPLDEMMWRAAGMDADEYCRRFLGMRTFNLNRSPIPGVACGPFVPLRTAVPFIEDAGRSGGKRLRHLESVGAALRGIEDIGSVRVPPAPAVDESPAITAGVAMNPLDGNEFKVFIKAGGELRYRASGRVDHGNCAALIRGRPFLNEMCRQARKMGLDATEQIRSRVAPILDYERVGYHLRGFRSHGTSSPQDAVVRMYANALGRPFVNLGDLFAVSRVDLLQDMPRLAAGVPLLGCDLPQEVLWQIHGTDMSRVPLERPSASFVPSDVIIPLFQANDFFDFALRRHKAEGTCAFRGGAAPPAIRRIRSALCVTERQYASLGET